MREKFETIAKFQKDDLFCLFLLFLFLAIRYKAFLTDIYFPDEIYHTAIMQNNNQIINYEGFGGTYWYLGHLISVMNDEFRLILRILSLLSTPLSGLILWKSLKTNLLLKNLLLAFFLTIPFFWYGGKLISPEYYILPLVFLAYNLLLISKKRIFSSILIGFAIGIKLNFMPILLPFLFEIYQNSLSEKILKNFFKVSLFLIIGFILASPNIIWAPKEYILSIPSWIMSTNLGIFSKLENLFSNYFVTSRSWDLVILSGLFQNLFSLINLIIFSIFIIYKNKKDLLISYFASILVFFVFYSLKGQLIWHGVALIPIFIFFILKIYDEKIYVFKKLNLMYIFLIFAIFINLNNISKFYVIDNNIRFKTYSDVINLSEKNTSCVINYIKQKKEKDLFYINSTRFLKTSSGKEILNTDSLEKNVIGKSLDLESSINSPFFDSKDNIRKVFLISYSMYDQINFKNTRNFKGDYFDAFIMPSLGGQWEKKVVKTCNNVNISELNKK